MTVSEIPNCFLSSNSPFRSLHAIQLVKVSNDLPIIKSSGQSSVLFFVDLLTALDLLDNSLLFKTLYLLGVSCSGFPPISHTVSIFLAISYYSFKSFNIGVEGLVVHFSSRYLKMY